MGVHSQLNPIVPSLIPPLPHTFIRLPMYLFVLLLFCKDSLCTSLGTLSVNKVSGLIYWECSNESEMVMPRQRLQCTEGHVYKSQSTREDEVRVTIEEWLNWRNTHRETELTAIWKEDHEGEALSWIWVVKGCSKGGSRIAKRLTGLREDVLPSLTWRREDRLVVGSPVETWIEGSQRAGSARSKESRSQIDIGSHPIPPHTSWKALVFGALVFPSSIWG